MKSLIVLCVLVVVSYCQIGGTHGPCSAVAVPGPFTEPISLFGTTNGATTSSSNCNPNLNGPTTWYSITPDAGSQITISSCSSYTSFDTVIAVYSGNCDVLSCVTVVDDSDDCQVNSIYAKVQFIATSELYYVAVTGYNGASGNFELTFSEVASNSSTCQTAIAVPGPYTTPITIYGNTQNSIGYNQGSCGLSTSSLIDWYILTPQAGSQVEVTTCNSVTNFDTRLAILTGSCSALSCLVSNDDNCTTNSYASYVTFVAGTSVSSYYLAVFGYGTASGAYEVRIVEHPVQSTPGGDCPSAIPLPFTSGGYQYYLGNTENNPLATTYACTSINSRSSWYRLDVPSGYYGEITVSTCNQGTNYDTLLAIYSGSCSQLLCVTYNDDNSCSLSSLASTAYWYASSSFDAEEKNVATISPTSTSSLSKSASASQSASSSPSSTYSATSSSTRSFVQPSPSPSRSNSANLGTVTYYIQVAGYSSSSVGTYGLSVQIQ